MNLFYIIGFILELFNFLMLLYVFFTIGAADLIYIFLYGDIFPTFCTYYHIIVFVCLLYDNICLLLIITLLLLYNCFRLLLYIL